MYTLQHLRFGSCIRQTVPMCHLDRRGIVGVCKTLVRGFDSHRWLSEKCVKWASKYLEKCVKCMLFYIEKCGTMEKLIPLLNERHNLEWILWSNVNWDYLFVKWNKENKFFEEQIISKKFWFIKWLVDNDKIDLENEELISLMSELWERRNPVKCLLMLLSIQDEPINFLVSILK